MSLKYWLESILWHQEDRKKTVNEKIQAENEAQEAKNELQNLQVR